MLVFVFVSNERGEKSLSKIRENGPNALPLTMFFLWFMRKAKIKATDANSMFRVLSRYSELPPSLYFARQVEDQLLPPLVCFPRFIPIFNVQGLAIETTDSFYSMLLPTMDGMSMKPLSEVPLLQSKPGGPTKLFYFNFKDIIKRLLKQEAAKGLSLPFFSVIPVASL